jgi:hypothetical protein
MNLTAGKLFGAIGSVDLREQVSALPLAGADPAFSRWYRLQWLKNNGFTADRAQIGLETAEALAQPLA